MSQLINLGCKVAGVHHRYDEIHGTLFGASSFRLLVDALLGRRRRAYHKSSGALAELRSELAELEAQVADPTQAVPVTGVDREVQQVLLEYSQTLDDTMAGLETIFAKLEKDEASYREPGSDDRSEFTVDKLHYDHLLSELERLGTRLNKLFSNY